jgi:hypothetical protein
MTIELVGSRSVACQWKEWELSVVLYLIFWVMATLYLFPRAKRSMDLTGYVWADRLWIRDYSSPSSSIRWMDSIE